MTLDWNTDWWNVKGPKVHAPTPRSTTPKPVPEPERLFQAQRHALDLLHMMRDPHRDKHMDAMEHKMEDLYRVINTYLKNNVAPSQGGSPPTL